MRFAKYHGTGNDFVMIEDLRDRIRLSPRVIAALCDRRRGVGADGMIRIAPASDADFFMDYWNSSGEVAEMCGNGIRCLAKYAYDRGLTRSRELEVATRAGPKQLRLIVEADSVIGVTVDMGAPALARGAIPASGDPDGTWLEEPLEVGGRTFLTSAVSMGNPHCVVFLPPEEDLASVDVPGLGSEVERRSDLFPNGTNVEFVKPTGDRIDLRVWERGSGETMACGTGACAALVACALAGASSRSADVVFPGGTLAVAWGEDAHLRMTGPAVCVFEGELGEQWLREAGGGEPRLEATA